MIISVCEQTYGNLVNISVKWKKSILWLFMQVCEVCMHALKSLLRMLLLSYVTMLKVSNKSPSDLVIRNGLSFFILVILL